MTDPTPTRAEVLLRRLREPAFGTETTERNLMAEAADMIQALRERAEAAERDWTELRDLYDAKVLALTEARRAEAAAWNDAIEAAEKAALDRQGRRMMGDGHGNSCYDIGVSDAASAIRALRRAAPTEEQR